LDWIDQVNSTIYISGVDVVNGSAVLDIKPYHPVESFGRDLQSSAKVETEEIHFADWLPKPQPCIDISWSDAALTELHELQEHCRFYPDDRDRRSNLEFPSSTSSELIRLAIDEALGLDPRPPQSRSRPHQGRDDTTHLYWAMDFDGLSIAFRLLPGTKFEVVQVRRRSFDRCKSKEWLKELQASLEAPQDGTQHAVLQEL